MRTSKQVKATCTTSVGYNAIKALTTESVSVRYSYTVCQRYANGKCTLMSVSIRTLVAFIDNQSKLSRRRLIDDYFVEDRDSM